MTKKIIAGVAIGALVGFPVGALAFTNTVEVPVINQTAVDVAVADALNNVEPIVINNTEVVEVEKIVEVPVNVTIEVPVDNGKLADVLQHIYDNNGDIEYLTDDLDDDEVAFIADRIIFVNEMKKLSVDSLQDELFDELDRETYNISGTDVTFDEDDLERLRIDDDEDEIVVSDVDFDDGDIKLELTGTFEQDDVRYDYNATAVFKDFEFDELRNIEVSEHN